MIRLVRIIHESVVGQRHFNVPQGLETYVRQRVGPIPRVCLFDVWPKAIITVAWGETPGNRDPRSVLADGHIHWGGQPRVTMAFGQTVEHWVVAAR